MDFIASRQPSPFTFNSAPWRPSAPAASAFSEVTSNVAPPLATVPPGPFSAPLSSDPYALAISVIPTSPDPPTVSAS